MAIARRQDGTEVQPGDTLVSFRGQNAEFVSAYPTRGEGRVTVKLEDGRTADYFPSVFDLLPIVVDARIEDVDFAREEAEDVKWTLDVALHQAGGWCWAIEHVAGPHPGCGEFTPEEAHMCNTKADVWVLAFDAPEYGPPAPEWMHFCDYHDANYPASQPRYRGAPDA